MKQLSMISIRSLKVAVLMCSVLVSTSLFAQSPTITSISQSSGVVGMPVEISGSGFGASQGSSTVALNGTGATATSWSDSSIVVLVPSSASSGEFSVTVSGQPAYSSSFTVTALPSGWSDSDVGSVGEAGSASYANGVFTVSGAGNQMYGSADAFHFAYVPFSGDGTIVARVTSAQGMSDLYAAAAITIRETLNAGATNATAADWAKGPYFEFSYRSTTNGSTNQSGTVSVNAPYWVQVVRSGNSFSGYASLDGVHWTQLGSAQTISMAQDVYIGLGVESGSTSSLATATFDNVSVNSSAAPAPVITSLSATTGSVGSQITIAGSGFGASQGISEVMLNSAPVTVNSWSATSITITLPATATSGPLVVVQGPSMNASNPAVFTVTSNPLPTGWLDDDVGVVGTAGTATYANGVFTVKGAGAEINSSADAFHFAYLPFSGDGSIVARLTSLQGTSNWYGAAAVMIRETLGAGATNAAIQYLPQPKYFEFGARTTTNGSTSTSGYISVTPPYWVKVVRSGNSFSGYTSPDGINWTQLGSTVTISMASNVYAGLAVESASTSSLAAATFDNVSVNSSATPAPVITSVSATTGSVGSQVTISGSGFGASQGSSEVMLNGAPVTINAWGDTSITITLPATASSGPLAVLLGPSMDASNPVVFTVTSNPLPSGWLDDDVGAVGTAGTATYANGAFTVKGAGAEIYSSADAFHFAYLPMSGNGSIVARVVSVQGVAGYYGAAGVMVRETLNAAATNATFSDWTQPGYFAFAYRSTTGGSASQSGTVSVKAPYWVQVVRSGNSFTGYASLDGVNWTQVGSTVTISMASSVYVGLAVESASTSSLATAIFDNVSVNSSATPAPVITNVSATTGSVGSQVTISGSGFGASQGSSEVMLNGAPVTINSWGDTLITITLPATASSGPLAVLLGPSMDASNAVVFTVTSNPLPSGWLDGDVGAVGTAGSATYANGTFSVGGAGSEINGSADAFHFAYLPVSGNGSIIARVASLQGTSGWYGAAAVMIRETLGPGATNAAVQYLPQPKYFEFGARTTTNGSTSTSGTVSVTPPYWVKVVRSGTTFTGYTSPDGANWTQVGSTQTISMASNAYVGLAVESASTSSLATATFDNVSSTFAVQMPAPAITSLSPSVAIPTASVTITGSYFGTTQGTSTVTFNGTPATPTSWSATSIVVPVPMGATSGNVVVTVGGVASNGTPFTVSQTPTIMSVSPTSGPVGTSVTISGVNFGSTQGTSSVDFNGTAGTPTSWSGTGVVVPVPAGATTGNVVVTTSNGSSSGVPFTVFQVPSITSLSTSSATIGSLLTITGTNFGSAQGTSTVTFNGVNGTSTSWTSTSIAVTVPVGATTGNVVVTVNGLASNAAPLTIVTISLPPVARVLPATGATGVPENGLVIVRFAQPVQSTAIIPGTVTVSQGTTNVSGSTSLSNDGLSVTFTPSPNLAGNTTFNVAVTDLAGNQTTPEFQSSFTTGSTADTVAPTIVQTNPPSNSTGVPTSAAITVQFSKAMDPASLNPQTFTVEDHVTGQNMPGMVQVDPSGMTASFVPQVSLGVNRLFSVSLSSSIEDLSGNSLSGSGFNFTTSFSADTAGPQLMSTSPVGGSTAVALNALIVLQFNKPLDVLSVSNGLEVEAGGQSISGAIALSDSNEEVTFTPLGGLPANTTYTVVTTSQVTDVGGLALSNPGSYTLTTGATNDTTTPTVAAVSPTNNSTGVPTNPVVQLQFSKPIDPLTVSTSTLEVTTPISGTNVVQAGTVSVSSDGLTATLTPSQGLNSYTTYSIAATTGITDLEGHALTGFGSSFTTGATTSSSSPTVQMVSPANGENSVPVNVRVDVEVSAALDPESVNNSSIVVSAGGTPVPGTVTLGSNGTTLTYVPSGVLAASTAYALAVTGVTDQAGNTIVPYNSSLTTGASGVANTTQPSVASANPANGATGVSVAAPIVLTFNEPIDLTTVTDSTVPISASGISGVIAGSYVLDASGTVLTFTPLSPMPASATITVQVTSGGVLDLSGNGSVAYSNTFSTGTGTDTTVPTVLMVTPANQSSGITPSTPVVLTFSKSLNPATINANNFGLLANGSVLSGIGISRSADNRVVTLNGYGFPASSTITVLATNGVTDLYGNPLANFQSQFTTGPAPSITAPAVVSQRPGNGATGVPVNNSIVLYFSQPMNATSVTGAFYVSQNGALVSGTTQVTDNGQVLQFTPSAALQSNALVQVFVTSSAQSASGIAMNAYQSSFITLPDPSTTTPTQISSSPTLNASAVPTNAGIDMAFNEALDPTTLSATTVLCYQNGNWFQSDISLVDGGTVIQVLPRSPLQPNTSTNCQVSTTLQGVNGIGSVGGGISFTTASGPDTVVPTILTVSPPNGLTNVGDNANIRLTFSKSINPLTANASTIQLTGGGVTVVPDSISFSNNNQMVLVVPHAPLPDNTVMTLTISGITDVAGNPVAPQATQFTTGAGPDVVPPVIVWTSPLQTNPYQAPTNVPLNGIIQIQANEPIDLGTVNSHTFYTSPAVNGTYSVSSDGLTATLVPSAPLAAGQQYLVYGLGQGITDLAGNLLGTAVSPVMGDFSFTTGTTTSTSAPQVTGISPANGATGIAVNAQVLISFNEPIDSAKLSGVALTVTCSPKLAYVRV